MRRTGLCLLALAVLLPAPPARAYVPEKTPRRNAEAAGRRLVAQPAARPGVAGVVIMRGGRVLWDRNADTPMVPASIMKLTTTTAAMMRFKPSHRFATRVLGDREAATVRRLWLVGGGDPTFSTRAYRRRRFLPKPTDEIKRPAFASGSPTVEQLAERVRRAGVRRVDGDLIADETLFDTKRDQQGWLPSYLSNDPDTGLLSALTVNEGMANLERTRVVPSPALSAASELRRALAARGISVGGVVRLGNAPRDAAQIARVQSPPVSEIVDFILRYSINYPAELLLKSLGAAHGEGGTTEAGAGVVREALRELKVPLHGFEMWDGSGLSVLNRIEPRTVAALLDRILDGDGARWEILRDAIPVAGRPGTLLRRMRAPPTGGNLHGKTGLIRHVRAMAGWVTASDGVPVVYVAMLNDVRRAVELTGPLDLFGVLLALYPG